MKRTNPFTGKEEVSFWDKPEAYAIYTSVVTMFLMLVILL